MKFDGRNLWPDEKALYNEMLLHREEANRHRRHEMQLRDALLVQLHGRLAYAVQRITYLMGWSTYRTKEELARLRQAGRLKR